MQLYDFAYLFEQRLHRLVKSIVPVLLQGFRDIGIQRGIDIRVFQQLVAYFNWGVTVMSHKIYGAVFGDGADPWAEFRGVLKAAQLYPRANKGVLRSALRGEFVFGYLVGGAFYLFFVADNQLLLGFVAA